MIKYKTLNKLTISTDCKNDHHFRDIPFNQYHSLLPNLIPEKITKKNKYIFYCYICQKNVELSKIDAHNGHDGIKLSLKEFLSKDNYLEYNSYIKHKNFKNILDKINQVIKDINDWKNQFDKKYSNFMKFLEYLYDLENNFFNNIFNNDFDAEKNYDYESLINIKEIYKINNDINNFKKNYNTIGNFSKLSFFLINKIKDINEQKEIKNIEHYYKGNKYYFNEEIKYKTEKNNNIFPLIKSLFQNCKHFVGYDNRYFEEEDANKNYIKLNNPSFHQFLLQIKRKFPKINHITRMRQKFYFSCAVEKKIIIIKTDELYNDMNIINSFGIFNLSNNDLNDIYFSLELSNKYLLAISEKYITIFDSYISEQKDENDFYKHYFILKKIEQEEKIDDIIQVSPTLFCTYSSKLMQIHFWDIHHMEIVTKIDNITAPSVNRYYMSLLNKNSLFFITSDSIYILSIDNMEIKSKINTGLISSFCFLPKNGILCAEIVFDYGPFNPFNKERNEYNIVQYQINGNEIKKISEKIKVHKDAIRTLIYLGDNIVLSCSIDDELKIWY